MNRDEGWLRGPAIEIAAFTLGQQLEGDGLYLHETRSARGGVREGLLATAVRIDYPQHALSAWLRLAQELRDPEWGALATRPKAPGSGLGGRAL